MLDIVRAFTYEPNLSRVASATDARGNTTDFTYDGNGNLTDDGVNTYLYDVESRLITATTALTDYTYDPFGRRTEKDVDGTVTRYVYAGATVIAEYDGLDQLQARYVPGLGIDRPVLMIRGAAYSYYHYDGSGSVIAMTDVFGVVVESYAYGPYGESADGDALGNPYRYTGRRLDAETGLYYYRARYYSASLGRFLQPDPAGYIDGLNLYAYVRNDPLNFVDPSGLTPQSSGWGGWDVLSGAGDYRITDVQRALASTGNVGAFWESRLRTGDPIASTALKSLDPPGGVWDYLLGGAQINNRLQAYARVYTGSELDLDQVRVDLMNAHIDAVDQDDEGVIGLLSPEQVASYHHDQFAEYGLPETTFGGTAFTGNIAFDKFLTCALWCSGLE